VCRVAAALTKDEHLAADLEQDVWLETLERTAEATFDVREGETTKVEVVLRPAR
jgi:hypothetical protein